MAKAADSGAATYTKSAPAPIAASPAILGAPEYSLLPPTIKTLPLFPLCDFKDLLLSLIMSP